MTDFDPAKIMAGVKEFQKAVDNIIGNTEVQKTRKRPYSGAANESAPKAPPTVEEIPGFDYDTATELDIIQAALDIGRDAYISNSELAHKIRAELLRYRRFQAISAAKGL